MPINADDQQSAAVSPLRQVVASERVDEAESDVQKSHGNDLVEGENTAKRSLKVATSPTPVSGSSQTMER